METLLEQLVGAAKQDAETLKTVTRNDGTSFTTLKGYGIATDDTETFQVYVVPVQQRTRAMREHYRVTFYLRNEWGEWKRTSRDGFVAAVKAGARYAG